MSTAFSCGLLVRKPCGTQETEAICSLSLCFWTQRSLAKPCQTWLNGWLNPCAKQVRYGYVVTRSQCLPQTCVDVDACGVEREPTAYVYIIPPESTIYIHILSSGSSGLGTRAVLKASESISRSTTWQNLTRNSVLHWDQGFSWKSNVDISCNIYLTESIKIKIIKGIVVNMVILSYYALGL